MKYQNLYMNEKQKARYQKDSTREYKSRKVLGEVVVENGIILPGKPDLYSKKPKFWSIGGVVDSEGHFVEESGTRYFYGGNYEIDLDHVSVVNERVLFWSFCSSLGTFFCVIKLVDCGTYLITLMNIKLHIVVVVWNFMEILWNYLN